MIHEVVLDNVVMNWFALVLMVQCGGMSVVLSRSGTVSFGICARVRRALILGTNAFACTAVVLAFTGATIGAMLALTFVYCIPFDAFVRIDNWCNDYASMGSDAMRSAVIVC